MLRYSSFLSPLIGLQSMIRNASFRVFLSLRHSLWVGITLILLTGLVCVSVSGCGSDEQGINPPQDQLYYPLGMAPHPDGRYLYVSNAVFDRKYNASTLMVFDTYTVFKISPVLVETALK